MLLASIKIKGSDKIYVNHVKSLDIKDVYEAMDVCYTSEFWALDTDIVELDTVYTIYNNENANEGTPVSELPKEGELYITDGVLEIN